MLTNIRFYVLSFSITLSIVIFFTVKNNTILTETYALLASSFLYFAILATPLTRAFPALPYKGKYIKARRAIGVSAFYFGLLHASFAFFGELGGFESLLTLPQRYLWAITFSFSALIILTLMASTSFDYMIDKLGFARWKFLHRFVYLAAVLILIHALLIGSHFQSFSGIIPKIYFTALIFLLILEAKRFIQYLQSIKQ